MTLCQTVSYSHSPVTSRLSLLYTFLQRVLPGNVGKGLRFLREKCGKMQIFEISQLAKKDREKVSE